MNEAELGFELKNALARIEALEADGHEATRLLDLWSEIPGAENFAPYQDTMAFLGKPNSVGWVWARQVREERDFDKEQARQRDLAMQCICEAEEREQAAHARIETLETVARLSQELVIELDTYWSGVSGPSLSGIMLDWRNKYRILLEDGGVAQTPSDGSIYAEVSRRSVTPEEDQLLTDALRASTKLVRGDE